MYDLKITDQIAWHEKIGKRSYYMGVMSQGVIVA